MKLKRLIILVMSVTMLVIADNAQAQKNKYKKRRQTNRRISHYSGGTRGYGRFEPYIYVGAAVNAGNYFGDLAPVSKKASTDISFTRPGFGIYGGYKFHHSMAVRAGLNWVRVFGDDFSADPGSEGDVARYARNLSFRNDIKEFQVGLEIYLLPNYGGPRQRLPLNAYLFVGAAVFHHEPMGKVPEFDYQLEGVNATTAAPQAGEWVKLRPLETEGTSYKNIGISIPVSVGAQFRLPGTEFTAGLEFGIRYLFTDYIDDVSDSYVDLDSFDSDLARIMSDRSAVPVSSTGDARDLNLLNIQQQNGYFRETGIGIGSGTDGAVRGNPDNNDMIFMTQIKLSYVIGGTTRRRAKYR
ncbi:MAG: hypothetical protein Tsb0034_14040 [Ekhidna sp.]